MVKSSLAGSTRKSYRRSLHRFWNVCLSHTPPLHYLPAIPATVALFIVYLHALPLAISTICSHVSAITFAHKFKWHSDPTQSFLIQRMIMGCKKTAATTDTRLPMLLPILHQMVSVCDTLFNNFDSLLYRTILLTAFHVFFRLGELLPSHIKAGIKHSRLALCKGGYSH